MLEIALIGKFIYDIIKRLKNDRHFRTLGFLLFVLVLVGTLFFWLTGELNFIQGFAYAVGTLAMNSPYQLAPHSNLGILFNIIYIFIGVGVYLLFVLEAGKTILSSHIEFEKKMAERKALKKAKKAAALQNKQ